VRRFSFGGKGRPGDGEQGAGSEQPQAGASDQAPEQESTPPPQSSEPASESWVPQQEEPWAPASDEPAPIHSEREHGLEGAQTPEGEVAHPTSSSEEPETARDGEQAQAAGGSQWTPQAQSEQEEQSHADGQREDDGDEQTQDDERGHAEAEQSSEEQTREQPQAEQSGGSRVSVVDEQPPRPAPPDGASEEEYKWHTYKVYPSGRPDAVEFIDTYKAFGRNRILRGLNMGLPEGMVSMILGPSGTGKSVCIKHMVGLLYPDEGDVLVHGESVPNMPDDDLFEMRKKFGLLFQDGALFGSMNLYDNVAFPLRQHTEKGEDEVEDIVMRRLNEVGLGDAKDKMPNELSGGMRKRAGFARALVLEPDIVLFDEPDSGLDPVRTALLGELILEIHRDMMEDAKKQQKERLPTFAVITHDIMSARRVADYINVLWKGRIVEAGPAEDMLNSDNPFIRQFLAGESQGPLTMD
jgi:phospholipid/cholesterol/gamma-HCH transport system ATP-binding protein